MRQVYFASDFHLGLDIKGQSSLERENKIINWLDSIRQTPGILHLVGDIFDYWFEYKQVVPKGYHHLFSVLSKMNDEGWEINYHTGNHDMWVGKYFEQLFGAIIHRNPITIEYGSKSFYIGHGDGLGAGDYGYKLIKKIFASKLNQWLFTRIHPNLGISIMKYISKKSRLVDREVEEMNENSKEILLEFARADCKKNNHDYYIFGHRHYPSMIQLENKHSYYINLGDWLHFNTYLVYDNGSINLLEFK